MTKSQVSLLAKGDKCYQNLEKKKQALLATPDPSAEEKQKAWKAAVEAYRKWAQLQTARHRVMEKVEEIELQQRKRLHYLKANATMALIHKIRWMLGPKYRKLPAPRVAEVQAGYGAVQRKVERCLPMPTVPALSRQQTIAIPSQPPPSA